ncbi:MAG: DUF928 domain-containing protein [Geminicoccaceae bacterium]
MNKSKCIVVASLAVLSTLAVTSGHAEEKAATAAEAPRPSEQKIAESLKKLIFVPHDVGAPEVTDAGGVRAISVLPKIELLAPQQVARALSPTPTLYWHVSKAVEGPVRFTLLVDNPTASTPLLEAEVDGIDQEGIYSISLEDHGLALENGKRYIWSIALSADNNNYSSAPVAQTMMEHETAPGLTKTLDGALPETRAVRFAAEGYWYDAVDTLSDQIGRSLDKSWQAARARLLSQAGLPHAARFDLQRAGE